MKIVSYWDKNYHFFLSLSLCILLFFVFFVLFFQELRASDYGPSSVASSRSPIREISLIISDEGYYPSNIVAFSGERVRFFVTSTTDLPSCLIVEGKEIFIEAKRGKVFSGEAEFRSPGKHRFYCPKGQIRGELTVLEHPRVVQARERRRELASQRERDDVKVWLPRDE